MLSSSYFLDILGNIYTLVESDKEFECISVLHGHTQDVKSVKWHPVKEVINFAVYIGKDLEMLCRPIESRTIADESSLLRYFILLPSLSHTHTQPLFICIAFDIV